jgi:SAM-dependent methyltransferase
MERADWLKERRRISEERYDTLWAPVYDDDWGATVAPTHQRMYARFLETCPPGSWILEAACGTGKYWPLILDSGRVVFGLDQSQGMLDRAKAKHPDVPVAKLGLQEMRFWGAFDGASCMDAMECIFPEDWPTVLANFYRALKPGGVFYFTVELADEEGIANAYASGLEAGLPLVYGEWMEGEGYHYYPRIEQVKAWLAQANFTLIEEAVGDEYHHFLVEKQEAG